MTAAWYTFADEASPLRRIHLALDRGIVSVSGLAGSSTALVVGALRRQRSGPMLCVVAHLDQADESVDMLQAQGIDACRFPAMEALPGESGGRPDLIAERLNVLRRIEAGDSMVVVTPIVALMQPIPNQSALQDMFRALQPQDFIKVPDLLDWMTNAGWVRAATVERPGEFALRGDVLDIYPDTGPPVRVDLFGDQVEGLYTIDLDTMGSARQLDRVDLVSALGAVSEGEAHRWLTTLLDDAWTAIVDDVNEVREQSRAYQDRASGGGQIASLEDLQAAMVASCRGVGLFGMDEDADVTLPIGLLAPFPDQAADAAQDLLRRAEDHRVVIVCRQEVDRHRMADLLGAQADLIDIVDGGLERGFVWGEGGSAISVVAYDEIVHRYQLRRRSHRAGHQQHLDAFAEIAPGDHVVHRAHGIALFQELRVQKRHEDGDVEEFLVLEFAQNGRLLVPVSSIDEVHRYIGGSREKPERSVLGSRVWSARADRAAESVRDLAAELLRVQAVRQGRSGITYPVDGEWQHAFEATFPWEETPDQRAAFEAVQDDMQASRPMDRLICGDVGFGKTEVAIRAAFRAAASGRQVAVLVPTTVLAEQHERTFRDRFAGFPFDVASLSRFKSGAAAKATLAELASGKIDVLIGTHRILSQDVQFKDLGLIVVDEEQRFGVEHKQRLLQLRATVDVLTMTATPIPRTLHMSMMGLRDISSLQSAPVDRRAVVTEVLPWDETRLTLAIDRELAREGQVFVVHNRISDLQDVAAQIQAMAPDARVVTGHGRMSPRELEQTMLTFMSGKADILVSTTIIESGIDIPNANTMIISEADRFGLAELHQLRGRVGRSRHRAYCYLLLPNRRTVNPDARRRLQALEANSMLGAGFRIALRDLELRGAGDLLGPDQSGHIAAVGYELYCRLLEQAVSDLRADGGMPSSPVQVDLGWSGYFPSAWIPGASRRIDAYRRLIGASSMASIAQVMQDLQSAYGEVPVAAQRFCQICELAVSVQEFGGVAVLRRDADVVFRAPSPRVVMSVLGGLPGQLRPVGQADGAGLREIWWRPPASMFTLEGVTQAVCAAVESADAETFK